MSNIIRIRRRVSGAAGAPSGLKSAELAYNMADNTVYAGYGDDGSGNATAVKPIGGEGTFAKLESPALTGTPTAPTQSSSDDSTKLATTAFVKTALSSYGAGSVTSVALSLPGSVFSVTGSPVTGAGTLAGSFVSQTSNSVFAAPNGSAGAPSFRALGAEPGSEVAPGMLLARSVDPALDAQLRLSRARVDELEASYAAEFVEDRARAEIVREQLEHERTQLARAVERAQGLQVAAAAAGRFVVPHAADLPGRYLRQGEVIGYVLGSEPPVVRVALDQASIDAVTASTREVRMRLAGRADVDHAGRILRQVPAGRDQVSSVALTAGGGGRIAADPRDPEGRRTLERVFEIDVAFIEPPAGLLPFGHRVHLRFEHPPQPVAVQLWRGTRRLFLRHFDV